VVLWDVNTKKSIQTFQFPQMTLGGERHPVKHAQFSPDGTKIAAVGESSYVYIFKYIEEHTSLFFRTKKPAKWMRRRIPSEESQIPVGAVKTCVQFSPDGNMIVVADRGTQVLYGDRGVPGAASVLNLNKKKQKEVLEGFFKMRDGVNSAQFSPTEPKMVTAGIDHTVRLWSTDYTESGMKAMELFTLEHKSSVASAQFSPNGTKIVSASMTFGGSPGEIRIWDVRTSICNKTLRVDREEGQAQVGFFSAQFSPDGTKIVSACSDNSVRVWDVNTEKCENTFENHCQGKMVRNPWYMKPVSRVLEEIDRDQEIADIFEGEGLWGISSKPVSRALEETAIDQEIANTMENEEFWGSLGGAGDSGAGDSGAAGKPEEEFVMKPGNVYSARFSPDGTKIVSAGSDRIVRMWDYNKLSGGSSIRRKTSKRKTSKRKTSRRKTSRRKTSKRKTSKRMKLNRKKMNRKNRKLKNKTRRRRSR
jgi:WD40 repeat protein